MKKFLTRIRRNGVWYFFLLILLVITPFSVGITPESTKKAICTALAVDALEEEYEVSALIFVPTPNTSYVENYDIVSGKGKNITLALEQISLHIGKTIALSHVDVMIINQKMGEGDLNISLDYFARFRELPNNVTLLCTDKSAKDLLKASYKMDKATGLKLDELIRYNEDFLYSSQSSLETFYQGYYSPIKSSLISFISLVNEESQGISTTNDDNPNSGGGESSGISSGQSEGGGSGQSEGGSSGQSGGGESGGSDSSAKSSSEQKESVISNNGDSALFKNGKYLTKLEGDIIKSLNYVNPSAKQGTIEIEDRGVKYHYGIRNKIVTPKAQFRNGLPVITYNITIKIHLLETTLNTSTDKLQAEDNQITDSIKDRINDKLKREFLNGLEIIRENQTDVIGVYEAFVKQSRSEFLKFLSRLEDPEDFLRYVSFEINTMIKAS